MTPHVLVARTLAFLCSLSFAHPLHAEAPPPVLERINRETIASVRYVRDAPEWAPGPVGNCSTMAVDNHLALSALGVESTIWVVLDEHGEAHAVVQSGPWVLDSRLLHVETRAQLERDGYRFLYAPDDFEILMRRRAQVAAR